MIVAMRGENARQEEGDPYRELVELLGETDAFRFIEAFGGRRVYVARQKKRLIARQLGQEVADALYEHYGNVYLKMPLMRNYRAVVYRQRGMSIAAIAQRLCMTEEGASKAASRGFTRCNALSDEAEHA